MTPQRLAAVLAAVQSAEQQPTRMLLWAKNLPVLALAKAIRERAGSAVAVVDTDTAPTSARVWVVPVTFGMSAWVVDAIARSEHDATAPSVVLLSAISSEAAISPAILARLNRIVEVVS